MSHGYAKTKRAPFNLFDEDIAVISTIDTAILSYTVASGEEVNLQGFLGTGSATARYKLKVDGEVKAILRTSAANRTEIVNFGDGCIVVTEGELIEVIAMHEEIASQSLATNIFGYLT